VYEHGGRPAGVVTFSGLDAADGSGSWGFYLDIDGLQARDELLPAWLGLERAAVAYAFDTLLLESLSGETLGWNTAVLALHRRFGFDVVGTCRRLVDGVPTDVVRTELRSGDRSHRPPSASVPSMPPVPPVVPAASVSSMPPAPVPPVSSMPSAPFAPSKPPARPAPSAPSASPVRSAAPELPQPTDAVGVDRHVRRSATGRSARVLDDL